jgi:signal transduction histidine kinase
VLTQAGEETTGICLEAMRNSYHHARSTRVSVAIVFDDACFVVRMAGDGRGMTELAVRRRLEEGHWSMLGTREHAVRINAMLVIDSKPGQGTTIEVMVQWRLAYAGREAGRMLSCVIAVGSAKKKRARRPASIGQVKLNRYCAAPRPRR